MESWRELERVGLSWRELDRVGESWIELDRVGESWYSTKIRCLWLETHSFDLSIEDGHVAAVVVVLVGAANG
jgi:hypothetical protein